MVAKRMWALKCEFNGCPREFVGLIGQLIPALRVEAISLGWYARNSAPERAAHDRCPEHNYENRSVDGDDTTFTGGGNVGPPWGIDTW